MSQPKWNQDPIVGEYIPGMPVSDLSKPGRWESDPVADVSAAGAVAQGLKAGAYNVGLSAKELAGKGLTFLGANQLGASLTESIPAARRQLGIETAPYEEQYPLLTGAGKFAAETAATLPIGFGLAAPFKAMGATGLATAMRTGGMTFGPMRFGDLAARALGGAATGGASAALLNDDPAAGAGFGAVLPFAVQAAAKPLSAGWNSLAPILFPKSVAANALRTAGDDQEITRALRETQNMVTTPGYKPTLPERLVEAGVINPVLSSLEPQLSRASAGANAKAVESLRTRVSALENQKKRIDDMIAQRQASNLPPGDLAQAQKMLSDALQHEYGMLIQQSEGLLGTSRQLGQTLPEGQLAPGESMIARAREMGPGFRRENVQPVYNKAFELAGNARIDVTPIVDAAEQILGTRLVEIAPANAPATVRALAALRPPPPQPAAVGAGKITSQMRAAAPTTPAAVPGATLEQVDALRKAINQDYASAVASGDPTAAQRLRNLSQLHPLLDQIIETSNIPAAAKAEYNRALSLYRNEYVPRFKTGITADVMRQSSKNEPRVLPSDVVSKYVGDENAARQFVTTFGQDPTAVDALRQGVADLFRKEVIDATTKAVNPEAAAKFLQRNKVVFDLLQRNGIDVRAPLNAVQERAAILSRGMDDLRTQAEALRKQVPTGTPGELVDHALKSPMNLDFVMRRLGTSGKSALADEVMTRINKMAPAEAQKYLQDNSAVVSKALGGRSVFSELSDLVKLRVDVDEVGRGMPRNVGPAVAVSVGNATPEQLTDLVVLAKDIQRMRHAGELARAGTGVSTPSAKALGTEQSRQAGAAAADIPTLLDAKVATAKAIWSKLEKTVNSRAAAQLAHYMFTDPDAALAALEAQARRRAILTPAVKVATPVARQAAFNAFVTSSPENALAQ